MTFYEERLFRSPQADLEFRREAEPGITLEGLADEGHDDAWLAAAHPDTPTLSLARIMLDDTVWEEVREDARANPNFDPLAVLYLQSGYADSMSWDEFRTAALDTLNPSR